MKIEDIDSMTYIDLRKDRDKLEKLTRRMNIFAVIFSVTALIINLYLLYSLLK